MDGLCVDVLIVPGEGFVMKLSFAIIVEHFAPIVDIYRAGDVLACFLRHVFSRP